MITGPHIIAVIVIAFIYALVCLVAPHKRCGRCKGKRRSARYVVAGPQGKCRKCRGNGKHPRFGARGVHWFVWSAIVDPLRERREDRGEPRQQFTARPAAPYGSPRHAAARQRAARRAERLIALQTRLQARAAPRAWQYA
jgi:hypothetical protein